MAPPSANLVLNNCRMCSSLALWCGQHCTALELQSRLCRTHFRTHGSQCHFCGVGGATVGGAGLLWQSCVVPDCRREVHICEECNKGSRHCGFVCDPCWSQTDHKCVSCKAQPAQTELRFVRRCRPCFSRDFLSREDAMVEDESKNYIRESPATKSGTALSRPCSCSFSHMGHRQSRHSHSLCHSMMTNHTSSVHSTADSACSHTDLAS